MRTGFHHRAGRCEVIAEGVVHQVAGPKTGCEDRARCAPIVARAAFRLVDRTGRGEDPQRAAARPPSDGRIAAEHVLRTDGLLALEQLVLARDRQRGQRGAAVDDRRVDASKQVGKRRRVRLGVRDLTR